MAAIWIFELSPKMEKHKFASIFLTVGLGPVIP